MMFSPSSRFLITTTVFLVVASMAVAAAAALPVGGSFVDDNGNIHEANIEAIRAAGITKGCNPPANDRYCPDASVTRGQMAAFLVRALDLPADSTDRFGDDDGSVFEDNINALAASGITKGCNPPANDQFCPDAAVTRGQMAAFLVRALDYSDPGTGDWFTDDDGSLFEDDIDKLRQAGVTKGCNPPTNTLFCPTSQVRRDEMASFLARALRLEPIVPPTVTSSCVRPPDGATAVREITVTPGQSPSIDDALSGAQPGDHILLAAGTHSPSGNLAMDRSGTSTDWIVIKPASGTMPVIDLAGGGEFRIGGSYVSLVGVDIRNGGGNNLHIAPASEDTHHVHVADSYIHDLSWGPGAAIKVNRNNTQNASVGTICIENNDVTDAIGNSIIDGVGVEGAVIVGNDIHDNAVGSHGIFFKGGSSDILIEGNLIRGIRANAALQLGGSTGSQFWNPAHPQWEGVDQVARNNIITDFDDSAVEIRGVNGAHVYNNTIVTQSSFAIFRLQVGNSASGTPSGNDNVHISSNLVIGTGGNPQYARNDGGSATITFGPQLWAGAFRNSGAATPGIPTFPQTGDVVVGSGSSVVVDPTVNSVTGIGDAIAQYTPVSGSPALGAAEVIADVVADILGAARSASSPTMGAIERP